MPLAQQPINHRLILSGPLVQRFDLFNFLLFVTDRDQTVLQRSKPNSRTTLIGEQPNPWNLLQLQDVMSRHRGAKQPRQYELSRVISLLSPAYLLSVDRWPFHTVSTVRYDQLSFLFDSSISQSSKLLPLCSTINIKLIWVYLCTPPLPFRRRPPQSNYQPYTVFNLDPKFQLVIIYIKSGISRMFFNTFI